MDDQTVENRRGLVLERGTVIDSALISTFREQAAAVQAAVSTATAFAQVCRHVVEVTCQRKGRSIAACGLDAAQREELAGRCAEVDLELILPPLRHRLEAIHTALTPAQWGIAETGTLLLPSASEDLRIATMVSEVHVAFLKASRIVPDLMAAAVHLGEALENGPNYVAFITGASRTADIERVLTIGVHGPQELHIILMENE